MLTLLCRAIVCVAPNRSLVPPRWTAHVGQRWDVIDVAPWNMFDIWWWIGQFVNHHGNLPEP